MATIANTDLENEAWVREYREYGPYWRRRYPGLLQDHPLPPQKEISPGIADALERGDFREAYALLGHIPELPVPAEGLRTRVRRLEYCLLREDAEGSREMLADLEEWAIPLALRAAMEEGSTAYGRVLWDLWGGWTIQAKYRNRELPDIVASYSRR